jgi:aldehyde:ferredoxin oxidoreductase
MPYGYNGRILHVDLDARTGWIEEPDERWWRRFGGGGLLGTALLLRDTPPGLDPFEPAAPLIFASSVVAGQPYPGLARFSVIARSPMTGGIGESRCEGPWGWALKGCGADVLVFTGASRQPVVAVIERGTVTIHDAADLAGMTVGATTDALETRFGAGIHVAAIGPAGEHGVRYASIVTDRCHNAFRHGHGAVMGSKGLKAVVIRGADHPPVADPERCADLAASYERRMHGNELTRWQLDPPGFGCWVHTHGTDAALCTRNYRESVFEAADEYAPEGFLRRAAGVAPCPGCPNDCIKRYAAPGDDPRAGGLHQEAAGTLGSNCGIADLDAVFRANVRCNEYGLDPVSLGFTISWAMECRERGLLDAPDAPRFGDADGMLATIDAIAERRGIGDLLAEGSARAAATLGNGSERYALHVKGLEVVPFEPRTQTGLGIGYATMPVGPRYDIAEHDWDFDTRMGWPHSLDGARTLGILERIDMDDISPEKVRNLKALLALWSAEDALGVCIFAGPPTRVYTLPDLAALLEAITGWSASDWEIMRLGERRLHLMQVYNRREGLTAAHDTLPDRFFDDPISQGRWAGTRLDREVFAERVLLLYRLLGWDDTGTPRPETLLDHGIDDAAFAAMQHGSSPR